MQMLLRGTSRAPCFEGDPQELQQYFEDVELLCEDAQLFADEDRIRWAVRYAHLLQQVCTILIGVQPVRMHS